MMVKAGIASEGETPARFLEGKSDSGLVRLYFEFLQLKNLFRQGWLNHNVPEARCESVAEHSLGVAFLAMLIADEQFPELDVCRVMKIAILHDLAEAYVGDITVADGVPSLKKESLEREAIHKLLGKIENGPAYIRLWEEYENQTSPEAVLVKQIDRLEMALQANAYEHETGLELGIFFESAQKKLIWPKLQNIFEDVLRVRRNASSVNDVM